MVDIAALGLKVVGVEDVDKASSSLNKLKKSSQDAGSSSAKLGEESKKSSKSLKELKTESDKAKGSVSALARAAKTAGGVLAAALSVRALVGGLKATIATYADFEAQMARVSAVSRASSAEFERLTATARKLGAETEFSANQAGAGLEFLARAGWSASDSIAAIPAILDLATAASLDLGSAADVASNIMSAYGIAAEDAANVSDVLAAATARANTDVMQLGDAMSYVGPVAASLKISMSDSAAAIGALSDAGIQGSSAGTGLRRILSSLANPTKTARDELVALGVSLKDVYPQTNDLADIIDTLADSGMDAAQALTVFGDRGGPAILALIEQRFKVRELSEDLRDVGGAASQMAEVVRDTLAGDLKGLSSAFADVQISIGKAFSSSNRSIVQALTSALRAFGENIETIANTVLLATKLVAAYVVAVYTIPAAKALASAATVAYTTVLRMFSIQAAITTKQLLSMRTGLSLAAAAFAGWEIGKYLREEFEVVEKLGIALMGGLHSIAIYIGGFFSRLGEDIKFALTYPLDAFRNKMADLLQWMTGLHQGALRLFGLEGLADSLSGGIEKIRSTSGEEHKAMLEQMRRDTGAEAAAVSDIYADMFADVGKSSAKAGDDVSSSGSQLADVVSDIEGSVNNVNDAMGNLGGNKDAILKEITALERAKAVWGMAANDVKLYDLRVMGANRTQLEHAESLLDTVKVFEQKKERQDNYLRLVQDLRTDEERLNDTLKERLAILDDIGKAGYQDYSRVTQGAFEDAPQYGGLAPEVGGPAGELAKIDDAQAQLQDWYGTQLAMLEQFRSERSDLNAHWDEREAELKAEHDARIDQIEDARRTARLAAGEEFFGNLAGVTKAFFGENSKLYKAAFLVEKAYAINKALINAPKSYSDAYAATVGIPVVGPALAPIAGGVAAAAQVAQASAIGNINMPSYDGGGYTGDGARAGGLDGRGGFLAMMHPKETVTDHTKGQSNGVVVNIHNAPQGTRTEKSESPTGEQMIDIWIADFVSDGRTAGVVQSKFGLAAQGR